MTKITGNTYPVKDQIKALGGRWNAAAKCWMIADPAKAAQALALVASAPRKAYASRTTAGAHRGPYGSYRSHGGGSAANVPGYSSYCTDRPGCRCFDCQ